MYYPDLSVYRYEQDEADERLVNVGWLDGQHEYVRGGGPEGLPERLLLFCHRRVNRTRGLHYCEICPPEAAGPIRVQIGDESVLLGSAEIRVFGEDGAVYAAPDLIYHYVTEHRYLPPEAFIEAVLVSPLPGTAEYEALLDSVEAK